MLNRTASNNARLFTRDTWSTTATTAIVGLPDNPILIGARQNYSPANFWNGEVKLVMIGNGLDSSGLNTVSNAVKTLAADLGW
jgi:hypothetical protein